MIRLYRFFSLERYQHGEPFAMCDECAREYKVPQHCVIEKIADRALWSCNSGIHEEIAGKKTKKK